MGGLLGLLLGLFLEVLPRFKGGRHSFVTLSRTCPSGHGFFALVFAIVFAFTVVVVFAVVFAFAVALDLPDFLPRFKGGRHSLVSLSRTCPSGHGLTIVYYIYVYNHI
jgi:hypothetical protein